MIVLLQRCFCLGVLNNEQVILEDADWPKANVVEVGKAGKFCLKWFMILLGVLNEYVTFGHRP
jgi:hypothetical protein